MAQNQTQNLNMSGLEFSDFEFVYDFERTPVFIMKEKIEEYLKEKGVLLKDEKIAKITIKINEETGYEQEPAYYDEGYLVSEYVPFTYYVYTIRLETRKKTIKMEIDDGNYDVTILEVKENKQRK